jgi:hypothetical protein
VIDGGGVLIDGRGARKEPLTVVIRAILVMRTAVFVVTAVAMMIMMMVLAHRTPALVVSSIGSIGTRVVVDAAAVLFGRPVVGVGVGVVMIVIAVIAEEGGGIECPIECPIGCPGDRRRVW